MRLAASKTVICFSIRETEVDQGRQRRAIIKRLQTKSPTSQFTTVPTVKQRGLYGLGSKQIASVMFSPVPGEWEENFQDLSGWCLPTTSMTKQQCIVDPAELNTPVLELGCEELQLNINVSKAEPNFAQDTEKKNGFWPSLDEPSFMNLWLPKNNPAPSGVETIDLLGSPDSEKKNVLVVQSGSESLANRGRTFPKSLATNNEAKMNNSVDKKTSTKMSTPKPKLKLNIPGGTVFNDMELSTPNIVRMLVESPTISNATKFNSTMPVELNTFDGPDDLLQPFGGGFDLLAYITDNGSYMFEESSKVEQTDINVDTVCENGVLEEEYTNINGSCTKDADIAEPCVITDGSSLKATDAEKPSSSKQSEMECKDELPQFTLPMNTQIKEEELTSSDDDDESYFQEQETRKRKLKKTSRKTSAIPSKRSSRSISSSSMSNLSDGMSDPKYRELRDRNNEASKRSRYNRKVRDGEMSREALRLEKENRSLKIKAEEMERLVKQLRESLLKTIAKPK